jgi:hypothetical protein
MPYKYLFPVVVATLLLGGGAGPASAQNASGLRGLFGTPAPAPAELAWRKVPRTEMGCIERGLAQQRSSVQSLIQIGVMPNDPRIGQLRTNCRAQAVPPVAQPATAPASPYVVDRLALGGRLQPDSAAYREFQCGPSEQFQGFTWCQKQRQDKKPGAISSSNSILHGQDGTAVYLNRSVEPATFERGEIDKEIERLSTKYGERARTTRMPTTAGVEGTAVIAQWGKIELEPLNADELAELAAGKDVIQGLRIDYLGDFTRSAKLGLPVYRIAGGAGFVWAASADQKGRGHLRFLASDASAYAPAPAQPPAGPEVAQAVKPDMSEQGAIAEAAKARAEADVAAPRTPPDAVNARVEDARAKPESDAAMPGAEAEAARTGVQTAVAQPAAGPADGAPAQAESGPAEANRMWVFLASGSGLVVVCAGVAFLLWRRGSVTQPLQARHAAEPHQDVEAPIVPRFSVSEIDADGETHLEAPIMPPISEPMTRGDAVAIAQAVASGGAALAKRRCAACGHEAQLVARFCSNCGSPIGAQG